MSFNPAVRGKHAGTHQDQYRTSKQQRLDAQAEIEEALSEQAEEDLEFVRHAMGIGPDFEDRPSWPFHKEES